ncbi:uncharacterized protein LOC124924570 [Impatiens glandulifera]|uniref:uncharacterized protein LOC124924570 n=1 Tax=Impatiens glandulifera TaxID=253017 RepID=UPI001FB07BD7|nr:uncharacterized protein LOC124924570 [Impatiens glandulifera]
MTFKLAKFKGISDPIVSEEWVQSMETIFEFMQILEVERVRCATFMLRDDARIWWQGVKAALDLSSISWGNLKRFYMLNHFLEGLNATIRRDVRLSNPSSMRETIDRALMAEKDSQDIFKEGQTKRESYQGREFHGPATKRPFNPSFNRNALPQSSYNQAATSQHSQQPKNFYQNNNNQRFSQRPQQSQQSKRLQPAGSRGHIQRDCPKKNEVAPGRVFSMSREEADPKTTIITGNLLIANILANTLIDTGGTHSFITACFVQKAGLKPEEFLMAYISLPSGSHLNFKKIIKACPIYNQNRKMLADLVVVDMVGFDLILGKDWLFQHEAQINCNKKRVVLTDQYGKTFLFRASPACKRQQLFLERATRVMFYNCAMIIGQKIKLEDIEVVRDFPS